MSVYVVHTTTVNVVGHMLSADLIIIDCLDLEFKSTLQKQRLKIWRESALVHIFHQTVVIFRHMMPSRHGTAEAAAVWPSCLQVGRFHGFLKLWDPMISPEQLQSQLLVFIQELAYTLVGKYFGYGD
jgi:hypothetical protein